MYTIPNLSQGGTWNDSGLPPYQAQNLWITRMLTAHESHIHKHGAVPAGATERERVNFSGHSFLLGFYRHQALQKEEDAHRKRETTQSCVLMISLSISQCSPLPSLTTYKIEDSSSLSHCTLSLSPSKGILLENSVPLFEPLGIISMESCQLSEAFLDPAPRLSLLLSL